MSTETMTRFTISARTRRMTAFTTSAFYLAVDVYEEFFLGERQSESGLIAFHHWLEFVVIALVVWCIWCEIRETEFMRGLLAEQEARHRRLSQDIAGHIVTRFAEWRLTTGETDIAWLLIKGFSFAEIAELRGVKDKTLRQQASQIYSKADVKGRSELSAAFLDDLIGGVEVAKSQVS